MRIKGITAHPGQASGVARVLTSVDEISKVQHGDVLVCRMTTPEWVPAFERASAIVTAEGGTLCHAAIVARSYGKPCVVAAKDCLKIPPDTQVSVRAAIGQAAEIMYGEDEGAMTKEEAREAGDLAKYSMIGGRRMSMKELEYYS